MTDIDSSKASEKTAADTLGFPATLEQFNQTLEAVLEMLEAVSPHVEASTKIGQVSVFPRQAPRGSSYWMISSNANVRTKRVQEGRPTQLRMVLRETLLARF